MFSLITKSPVARVCTAARLKSPTRLLHRRGNPTMREGQREHQVIFVRHGQSTWNKANRFIGWTDTALTEEGLEEAREAGRIMVQHKIDIDEVHTSLLQRSIKTATLILQEMGREYLPMHCHWRLNERSYGALTGRNKKECVKVHGVDQVKAWRRSYDVRPPPMDHDSIFHPRHEADKYANLSPEEIPLAESLHDTKQRAVAYWEDVIVPQVRAGKRLLIVGHENNLRSLLMHIDGITKDDVVRLEIPRAVPILYRFDADTMRPIQQEGAARLLSGRYLIPAEQVAALQERDLHQVYDVSIKVNLEELALQEALALVNTQVSQAASAAGKRQKLQQRASQLLSAMHQSSYPRPAPTAGGQKVVGQRSLNMLASPPQLLPEDDDNNGNYNTNTTGGGSNNSDSKGEA